MLFFKPFSTVCLGSLLVFFCLLANEFSALLQSSENPAVVDKLFYVCPRSRSNLAVFISVLSRFGTIGYVFVEVSVHMLKLCTKMSLIPKTFTNK